VESAGEHPDAGRLQFGVERVDVLVGLFICSAVGASAPSTMWTDSRY